MVLLIAKHFKIVFIKEIVKNLSDENILIEIIKNDTNLFVIREIAAKQIADENLLKEIIFDTSDTTYAKNIFDIREIAVKQITDDETLSEIVDKFYDETAHTEYGLNVVKRAIEQINSDDILMEIAEKDYDEEVINLALERINNKYDKHDKTNLKQACDDDIKVKRLSAVDKIDDDETLLDIAMNAKYLDVRERAVNNIKNEDDRTILLNNLIQLEKEYYDLTNEYIVSNGEKEENKEEIIHKASNLGVEYKKLGNSKKEKFYNEQCNLFKNI